MKVIGVMLCVWISLGSGAAWAAERAELDWEAWEPLAGKWTKEGEVILGRSSEETAYLRTKAEYADFDLALEFFTPNPAEGGVTFRGHWLPKLPAAAGAAPADLPRTAYGYRATIDTGVAERTACVTNAGSGQSLVGTSPEAHKALRPGEWNLLEIHARGPVIETVLNGVTANRLFDESFLQGYIILKVSPAEKEVRFRRCRIANLGRLGQWRSLFNGRNLDGWRNWGEEEFTVEDGVILGRSGPKKSEGYLCTEESWKDFRVRGRFRMYGEGNFGLFYHSTITLREDGFPVISGVQGEVEPSYPGSTGWHYESYRRGWLVQPDRGQVGAWALRPGQWNEIEIRCVGNRVTSWVNGIRTSDFFDPQPQVFEGGFALQLHTQGVDPIAWKELYVTDVDAP